MADEAKVIVVKTDNGTPPNVDISLVDLRDVVLNQPEVLIDALRQAFQAGSTGSTGRAQLTGGALPPDTPVAKMLDPSVAEVLTTNARKLTKADILALGGFTEPAKSAKDLGLTVDDVRSLELAFHQDFQGVLTAGGAGLDEMMDSTNSMGTVTSDMTATGTTTTSGGGINCCCCPCCCCTAAVELEPLEGIA